MARKKRATRPTETVGYVSFSIDRQTKKNLSYLQKVLKINRSKLIRLAIQTLTDIERAGREDIADDQGSAD